MEKLEASKEVISKNTNTSLDFENSSSLNEEPAIKIRSVSKLSAPNNKKKRARRVVRAYGTEETQISLLNPDLGWGATFIDNKIAHYWKQTVLSLLDLLKESCNDKTSDIITIEKLIQSKDIPVDELTNQISCLSIFAEKASQLNATKNISFKVPTSTTQMEVENNVDVNRVRSSSISIEKSVHIDNVDGYRIKDKCYTMTIIVGMNAVKSSGGLRERLSNAVAFNAGSQASLNKGNNVQNFLQHF
uniref:Uncharacterized protein n=1 Tax=Lactuca sativa TaxID=4236 RepID=A0A9R1VM79_LACSA|nr:hypothetical protein LSAT_V11C500241760 [Lactuca sativa]